MEDLESWWHYRADPWSADDSDDEGDLAGVRHGQGAPGEDGEGEGLGGKGSTQI